jgi:hypothetical protein
MSHKEKRQRVPFGIPQEDLFALELPESNQARLKRLARSERDHKKRAVRERRLDNDYWN